jgi:G3E family GTPase
MPVAETFMFEDQLGRSLSDMTRLDTLVTVVDAFNLLRDTASGELLTDRKIGLNEEDERSIADLLIDQIEFADVVVVNKTDLVSKEDLMRLEALIRKLNTRARIIFAEKAVVPLESIMDTRLFNFEQAALAPGWLKSLNGEHVPETEEYGISSFVYSARRPFHPQRFYDAECATSPRPRKPSLYHAKMARTLRRPQTGNCRDWRRCGQRRNHENLRQMLAHQ